MTETKLSLAQKLVKVYEEVDHVSKRGSNTSQNYKYVKAGDLAHAIRNALAKLNIYAQVTFSNVRPWSYTTSKGSTQNAFDVQCDIEFFDADDPSVVFRSTGLGSGADFGDKGIFKAQTGALKYALRNAFLVPDDTDPENDENDKTETKAKSGVHSATAADPNLRDPQPTAKKEPVKPEKAAIPTSLNYSQPSVAAPEADGNEVPNEEELKPFRKAHMALVKRLSEAGLTAETGNPQKKKVTKYLLSVVGADTVENVTKGQWRTFFAVTDNADVKNLVQLVEAAGK